MAPVIRGLNVDDLFALEALEARAQPLPWSDDQLLLELVNDDALVLGLFDPVDGLVAHLCLRKMVDEMWIMNLAVDPAHRRRGLARQLMREAQVRAREQQCATVWLEVREGNAPARALYTALGYDEKGRRTGYYPPIPPSTERETAVLMARSAA